MRLDRNFVNGHFIEPASSTLIAVFNPATEALLGEVSAATPSEAMAAVDAAAVAQQRWGKLTSIERAEHLRAFADAIDETAEFIGVAPAAESGKSAVNARNEARYAAQITRYHAEWARGIEGEIIPCDSPNENLFLHREPIGVVASLIPFNYPVYTLLRKIAPALIAGNTVVVRPSNSSPTSAFEIAKAAQQSGLPAGVLNIRTMDHTTAAVVCTHKAVGLITLTGSVNAGRVVLDYCKANTAKPSLELGGKTPAIVEADADLEKAATDIVASKTTHFGQICTAVERVYVQESVYDQLLALLKTKLSAVPFGDRAVADGAVLETGGSIPRDNGHFYPSAIAAGSPTLRNLLPQDSRSGGRQMRPVVWHPRTDGTILCDSPGQTAGELRPAVVRRTGATRPGTGDGASRRQSQHPHCYGRTADDQIRMLQVVTSRQCVDSADERRALRRPAGSQENCEHGRGLRRADRAASLQPPNWRGGKFPAGYLHAKFPDSGKHYDVGRFPCRGADQAAAMGGRLYRGVDRAGSWRELNMDVVRKHSPNTGKRLHLQMGETPVDAKDTSPAKG